MQPSRATTAASVALLFGALPLIAAHGDGHMEAGQEHKPKMIAGTQQAVPNYFRHPHYAGWMYAHIALMITSWVFVLPPALMLSAARSKHHLPAQLLFHSINGLGMFTGFVYNHATPDLYVSNSHHPIGWVVTSLTVLWTLLSLVVAYTNGQRKHQHHKVTPRASRQSCVEDTAFQDYVDNASTYRYSRDSGNFSGGSRSNSSDSIFEKDETIPLQDDQDRGDKETHDVTDSHGVLRGNKLNRAFARGARFASHAKILATLRFSQIILEKFLLLLGFLAVTSGFIVYGGLFKDREIYSGLAHYVKGGIFFWYGFWESILCN
jgi:hypothetical protein